MINETGGNLYLEGYTDFTLDPEVNIEILSIAHNEKETRFVPKDQVWEEAGRLPLSEAPRGFLEFESVKKDDTLTVIYTVETLPRPASRISMIQLVKIYVNGELLDEPVVNLVRR